MPTNVLHSSGSGIASVAAASYTLAMRGALLFLSLAGVAGAAGHNPTEVLSRVRDRVIKSVDRLPNYTCVETINRTYFQPSLPRPPKSCDEHEGDKRQGIYQMVPASADRLRLDVAAVSQREIFSWAGAQKFEDGELWDIVQGGAIGTGAFGAFLSAIFGGEQTWFTFVGENDTGGRALMEFTYAIPAEFSHYQVRAGDEWITTAYDGTVIADADTGELVTLKIRTAELPPITGSCETRTTLEYRTVRIGSGDFLLPWETRQRFISRTGIEAENAIDFSACRQYRGESTVHFGEDTVAAGPAVSPAGRAAPLSLPPDLAVSVELDAAIDTETAAAGDVVGGRLAKPIFDAHKHPLVAAGSLVQGRLMRVQRYFTKPPRATVVIKLETLEVNGSRVPFPVLPVPMKPPVEWTRTTVGNQIHSRGVSIGEMPAPGESRYSVLLFTGNAVVVPKGYLTQWLTAAPAPSAPTQH